MTDLNLEPGELEEYLEELTAAQRKEVISLLGRLETADAVRERAHLIALIYDALGLVTDDELEIIGQTQNLTPDEARQYILIRGVKLGYIDADEEDIERAQGYIDG